MKCRAALALVAGLLILASPSWAQQEPATTTDTTGTSDTTGTRDAASTPASTPATTQPKPKKPHKFEIIPMGGYVWTTSQSATYTNVGGDIDLKNSNYYGIAVDINVMPVMQFRLLYRRQSTEATFKRAGGTDNLGDVAVEYWHLGVVKAVKKTEKAMPYTSFTLGGTRYAGDGGDDWKFSVMLGLGAKIYVSERIGLMVAGHLPFTFTSTWLGVGTGGASLGGTGILQLDVTAGVMIAI